MTDHPAGLRHTPGPWFIAPQCVSDLFGGSICIASAEADDAIICSLGGDVAEETANANLIAAAPDLLQAVLAFHSWFSVPSHSKDAPMAIMRQAVEAIVRALPDHASSSASG